MENLIFSLNATFPIFLLMLLGNVFYRIGIIDDRASSWMNKFVFKVALPVLVFQDLATQDFAGTWNTKFVAFCFVVTCLSVAGITLLSGFLLKDMGRRGEFIQASYRSSAALLGIAFIHNIYGNESNGMGPLMILGSVPLYNIFAVIILTLTAEKEIVSDPATDSSFDGKGSLLKKTLRGIVTNPIIIGIFLGLLWSLLRIPQPRIMQIVISDIGALATPLGLMAMGAAFDFSKAVNNIWAAVIASFIKLIVLPLVFIPLAISFGFVGEQIVAILVMLGSATTVSCYIMSKTMGHEGTLSSSVVMLTTFGCSFTLTFWLYILKALAVI